MKRIFASLFLFALLCAATSGPIFAQGAAPAAAPTAPALSGREEAVRNFSDAADKILRLAQAIPAEKFTWRPMDGVRSVSEVFLHLAAGNFSIPRRIGAQLPEGIQLSADFDKQTSEKARVLEILKQAIEHARGAMNKLEEADLSKTSPWLGGRQATYREIMFFIASHNHEHLGQAIAYARMNGVVPPWTEEAQQRQQSAPPKKQP